MLSSGTTPHLLLVEDSEDDAFFFKRVVRQTAVSLHLTHVSNGLAAVDLLKGTAQSHTKSGATPPDLVFLDLKMPELNGFEVLAWVRQQPELASLKIAVLSGSEDSADIHKAMSLGAVAFFAKPIQADQLSAFFLSLGLKSTSPAMRQPHTSKPA